VSRTQPAPPRPSGALRRWSPADARAASLLVAFALLVTVPPSLAGYPLLAGDNLIQNFPLRVLAGEVLRSGHLPAWDSFLWSGTPLLAGWNAGALYPGTWLFAFLPAVAAWTLNLASVGVVASLGSYALSRRLGCGALAATLAATTFTWTGFMSGQLVHLGLVQGTSFLPWTLLALEELRTSLGRRRRAGLVVLLAAAVALTVLAGDPRAVSTAAVAVAVYLLAALARGGRAAWRLVVDALVGGVGGLALSAAQWVPGVVFVHGSQRGVANYAFYAAGSLSAHEVARLVLLPFLLGGSGVLGTPTYFGTYNLPEVTIGSGLLALSAAAAYLPDLLAGPATVVLRTLGRPAVPGARRERSRRRRLGTWYAIGALGVLLTLGGTTPLGHLLAAVPLFGGERLQNRNAALFDLCLAVLLGFLVDDLVAGRGGRDRPLAPWRLLAAAPVACCVAAVSLALADPAGADRLWHLPAGTLTGAIVGRLVPYLAAVLAIAGAAGLLALGARLPRRARRALACFAVLADVAVFMANLGYGPVSSRLLAGATPASRLLARLTGRDGRFAVYNPAVTAPPGQPDALDELGVTDLNILRGIPSVQGYGSIVQGRYEDVTSTHAFQSIAPSVLASTSADVLDLRTLVTLPGYLAEAIPPHAPVPRPGTAFGTGAAATLRRSGPWRLAPGARQAFALGQVHDVVRATVALAGPAAPRTLEIGVGRAGALLAARPVPVRSRAAELVLASPRRADEIVVANRSSRPAVVESVVVVAHDPGEDERLVLDGPLQGALAPSRWRLVASLDGLSFFRNGGARGLAWLAAPGARDPAAPPLRAGRISVRLERATAAETMLVDVPRPALLVRSETYSAGWTARVTPVGGGPTRVLTVERLGLVQAVRLGPGRYRVVWRYAPVSIVAGLLASGLGLAALLSGLAVALRAGEAGEERNRPGAPAQRVGRQAGQGR